MLSRDEAFKFGFVMRCLDEGLSREETLCRAGQARVALAALEKQAEGWPTWLPTPGQVGTGAVNTGLAAARLASGLGLAGVAAAGVGGAAGGYGLAKMTEPDVDPDAVKKQELIAAYQQQADRIRRTMAARRYRDSQPALSAPSLRLH